MSQCWQFVPEERPTFTELVTWTENMLKNSGDYLDLSPNLVNNVTYLQPLFIPGNYFFYESCSPKIILLGGDSLWGDCTFIPADWGS